MKLMKNMMSSKQDIIYVPVEKDIKTRFEDFLKKNELDSHLLVGIVTLPKIGEFSMYEVYTTGPRVAMETLINQTLKNLREEKAKEESKPVTAKVETKGKKKELIDQEMVTK